MGDDTEERVTTLAIGTRGGGGGGGAAAGAENAIALGEEILWSCPVSPATPEKGS